MGGTYAVTDQLQFSIVGLVPLVKDQPFFFGLTGKYRIPLLSDRLHLAAMGTLWYLHDSFSLDTGGTTSTGSNFAAGDVQGVLTYCFDGRCGSTVTGFFGVGFSVSGSNSLGLPLLYGASVTGRVSPHVKFLAEIDSGGVASLSSAVSSQVVDGLILTYGVRFNSRSIAVDLGFARPIAKGLDFPLILGVPIVTFSYRTGG
jgi:hypothetical protein